MKGSTERGRARDRFAELATGNMVSDSRTIKARGCNAGLRAISDIIEISGVGAAFTPIECIIYNLYVR